MLERPASPEEATQEYAVPEIAPAYSDETFMADAVEGLDEAYRFMYNYLFDHTLPGDKKPLKTMMMISFKLDKTIQLNLREHKKIPSSHEEALGYILDYHVNKNGRRPTILIFMLEAVSSSLEEFNKRKDNPKNYGILTRSINQIKPYTDRFMDAAEKVTKDINDMYAYLDSIDAGKAKGFLTEWQRNNNYEDSLTDAITLSNRGVGATFGGKPCDNKRTRGDYAAARTASLQNKPGYPSVYLWASAGAGYGAGAYPEGPPIIPAANADSVFSLPLLSELPAAAVVVNAGQMTTRSSEKKRLSGFVDKVTSNDGEEAQLKDSTPQKQPPLKKQRSR